MLGINIFVRLLLCSTLTAAYLVPHNFNPEIDDSIKDLSDDQLKNLIDDTFELIKEHNTQHQQQEEHNPVANSETGSHKKLSDYHYEFGSEVQKDTFNVVNDIDDGVNVNPEVGNILIVIPDEKSSDFDVFYRNSNSDNSNQQGSNNRPSGGNNNSSGTSDNVQRDTFHLENDFEDEQARLEEFNKLKNEDVNVENDTFQLKNDLDDKKSHKDHESL